jgi:phosphatidylglycerophosphate synthase
MDWFAASTGINGEMLAAWQTLLPALLVASYFVIGFAIYLVRYTVAGPYRDKEMEARTATPLANMFLRLFFAWSMQPVWKVVLRSGVPANAITTLSVLVATASGVAISMGHFALGGWLYIFSGICDFLDGRLARARNTVSKSGAALDSILDRYSDSAVLVGLAWYYRDSWVLLGTQLALVGSSLVPYIRARGEAIGVSIKEIGFMQRAERILYLGVAVAMSPVVEVGLAPSLAYPQHRLAVIGVVLLAVSTQITALQRFVHLIGTLDPRAWDLGWVRIEKTGRKRRMLGAVVATFSDYAVMEALAQSGLVGKPLATFLGLVVGATVAFFVNRIWRFATPENRMPLVGRYTFAAVTSAALNAGGMAVLLLLPALDYHISWILVHVAVFLAWNFPLYRDYFERAEAEGTLGPAVRQAS